MTIWVIRAIFLLAFGSIGYQVGSMIGSWPDIRPVPNPYGFWGMIVGLVAAGVIIGVETMFSRRPIRSISAIIFGLIAGFIIAYLIYNVAFLALTRHVARFLKFPDLDTLQRVLQLVLICLFTYVMISVIYKTRDRFRFIIPYVEFQKEEKRAHPILLDTSAIIDGRMADICDTGIIDSTLIVPKFVLQELQDVADSRERLRRQRGRRGLEVLNRLQRNPHVEVQIEDARHVEGPNVDNKLVNMANQMQGRIMTCDYNLSKIAELQGVAIVNVNELANALRPVALPGEELSTKIIREGEESGQGIGYLPDGTMIVIEQGREKIGQTVTLQVTSVLQTSAGRMVFGKLKSDKA